MLLGRRSWIKTASALAFGKSLPAAPAGTEGDSLIASSSVAVTETASGKVRGFVRRGVYAFRGIPYGAPTSGERRFMPPAKPAPWKDVRSSLTYGYVSPQEPRTIWDKDEVAFVYQWDDGFQHEDCLRVNIWTQGLEDCRVRSFHCADLPFVFDNTDRCDAATGGGPSARALAAKVSEAWIRFARTGDPNHNGLPKWPAFTAEKQATMVFDNTCTVAYDADREELNVLASS